MTKYGENPNAQRFIPNDDPRLTVWVGAGKTPSNLTATDSNSARNLIFDNGQRVYHPPGEIGPAMLRPDGTVFQAGANCPVPGPVTDPNACRIFHPFAHTAIFDPSTSTWTAGPDFPGQQGSGDSYSSLLPNGNVLQEASEGPGGDHDTRMRARYAAIRSGAIRPVGGAGQAQQSSCGQGLTFMYEFNGTNLIPEPQATFCGQPSLLLLPTGEVMMSGQYVYASTGTYQPSWAPTITKFSQLEHLRRRDL